MKIRKGDRVRVLTGKDRGKRGRVISVDRVKNRVLVQGVMMIKRHTRPNPQRNIKGGIAEREATIHVSNLMLVCSKDGPTKVGYRVDPNGEKHRVCRKCGAEL